MKRLLFKPLWLTPVLAAAAIGCSERGRPGDAGRDGGRRDASVDSAAIMDQRSSRDQAPEAARDLVAEGAAAVWPDGAGPDGPLPAAKVLYAVATDPDSLSLREVSTAGGKPVPVSGWSGYVDLQAMELAGLQEYVPVSPGRPQVQKERDPELRGIRLPGSLGTLYYYHRKLLGTSGLLLVRPDGALQVVREVPGVYTDALADHLALEESGKRGAAVQGAAGAFLFRTDGLAFPGGASWTDLAPSTLGLSQVLPRSLTIAGEWLYCVGQRSSGENVLLRAPLDGTGPLAAVTLPASAGQVPVSIDPELAVSRDGTRLALAAGTSATVRDLFIIDAASGTAKNATRSPGVLLSRGGELGYDAGLLALSPQGNLAGYVASVQGQRELWVVRTDGASTPVMVTSDNRYDAEVGQVLGLVLPDEDHALFLAGRSFYGLDLYLWDHTKGQAKNLSSTGSGQQPFDGQSYLSPRGAWISSSGKWLYWILFHGGSYTTSIVGVDLTSLALQQIVSQVGVVAAPGTIAVCEATGRTYFFARTNPLFDASELWVFDQEVAQPATRITHVIPPSGTQWLVSSLSVAPGCSRVTWAAGWTYSLRHWFALSTAAGGPPTIRKSTPAPMFLESATLLTPDQSALIYGSGGSSGQATLKAVWANGGTPLTLDPSAGTVLVLAVH